VPLYHSENPANSENSGSDKLNANLLHLYVLIQLLQSYFENVENFPLLNSTLMLPISEVL